MRISDWSSDVCSYDLLLTDDFSAAHVRDTLQTLESAMPHGWPCWSISKHDVRRVISRWGGEQRNPGLASLFTALLCSLRGSACIYQGEELGLTEAEVPYEALQDPYGKNFWPTFKGRDGCRTPMPWNDSPGAGFSSGTPWLPIPAAHRAHSVATQEADPDSVLHGFRRFMQWRKNQPCLRWGDISFLDTAEPLLAFIRRFDGDTQLMVFNLGSAPMRFEAPLSGALAVIAGHGLRSGTVSGKHIELPGYSMTALCVL